MVRNLDLFPPDLGEPADECLTFDLLDDLMELPEEGRAGELARIGIRRIGPLVEYAYHEYENACGALAPWHGSSQVTVLADFLRRGRYLSGYANTSLEPDKVEFIWIPSSEDDSNRADWLAFRKRFEYAAVRSGLEREFAKALTSTMIEMTDNVLLHSQEPLSAVAGYRSSQEEFEYVVADTGIGVYRSFKNHPDYADLRDSTEALRLATLTGESRFGRKSGHGFGFHQLIENIAKRDSSLRFRSGDASLNIEGSREQVNNLTRQCAFFKGFLISVVTKSSHTPQK